MSRVCELSGKAPMTGNTVSHANNKSRRRFLPNLNVVTLISDVLGQSFKLRISAAALRTVDHRGLSPSFGHRRIGLPPNRLPFGLDNPPPETRAGFFFSRRA